MLVSIQDGGHKSECNEANWYDCSCWPWRGSAVSTRCRGSSRGRFDAGVFDGLAAGALIGAAIGGDIGDLIPSIAPTLRRFIIIRRARITDRTPTTVATLIWS